MKKFYILLALTSILLASCTKRDLLYEPSHGNDWMRNREKGIVTYVDYYTGNYIVNTYNGYAVVEIQGGVSPREYDEEYAYFSNRGLQTTYNRTGDYFTDVRIIESWLSYQDARYILDQLNSSY